MPWRVTCLGPLLLGACADLGRGDEVVSTPPAADTSTATEAAADSSDELPSEVAVSCDPAAPFWGLGEGLMLPGTDCLSCHMAGQAATRHPYTLAGTVFGSRACPTPVVGAVIRVVDKGGATLEFPVNAAGNFYTDRALATPWTVSLVVGGVATPMTAPVSDGRCNSCHQPSAKGYIAVSP